MNLRRLEPEDAIYSWYITMFALLGDFMYTLGAKIIYKVINKVMCKVLMKRIKLWAGAFFPGLTRPRTPCCLLLAHLRRRRLRQPRNIRFETRLEIAGEIVVFTPNLDTLSKAFPVFRVLQTVLMNDFCGSEMSVCKHNISRILIGYTHCLCRHLHQSLFSTS